MGLGLVSPPWVASGSRVRVRVRVGVRVSLASVDRVRV